MSKASSASSSSSRSRALSSWSASKAQLPREYKLVVVGGGAVGKSALTIQFFQSRFVDDYDPTIEDCYHKHCLIDEELVSLEVLDTAGQDDYTALRQQWMRHGHGFLIVYSITSRESFEEVITFHQQILRVKDQDTYPVVIVGNKCDLEYERQVGMHEGRELASHLMCRFLEASAKLRINVDEAFVKIVREIQMYDREQASGRRSATAPQTGGIPDGQHETRCCIGCVVT